MSVWLCQYPGCGETFNKPVRGQERVTNRPVWLCPHCSGRVSRPNPRRK